MARCFGTFGEWCDCSSGRQMSAVVVCESVLTIRLKRVCLY